jgi:hypothetical protein
MGRKREESPSIYCNIGQGKREKGKGKGKWHGGPRRAVLMFMGGQESGIR